MKSRFNIHQIFAGLLFLIFAFGITPKKVWHDLIVQHQHHSLKKCSHHHLNIKSVGFNCDIDNVVVEMPFISVAIPFFQYSNSVYTNYSSEDIYLLITLKKCNTTLRGPPVC